VHAIRAGYGWTDDVIIDHVERYGIGWVLETWMLIKEDQADHYSILMSLLPLARTPMDKKSGDAMKKYSSNVIKMLDGLTPWRSKRLRERAIPRGAHDGKVVVILEPGEGSDNPLYANATVTREN
jgi:hypothetical protein